MSGQGHIADRGALSYYGNNRTLASVQFKIRRHFVAESDPRANAHGDGQLLFAHVLSQSSAIVDRLGTVRHTIGMNVL
jgi:hypothetical protein